MTKTSGMDRENEISFSRNAHTSAERTSSERSINRFPFSGQKVYRKPKRLKKKKKGFGEGSTALDTCLKDVRPPAPEWKIVFFSDQSFGLEFQNRSA